MNWKGYERKRSLLNFKELSDIRHEGLSKTTKNLGLDSRSPERDLTTENEA
jgi:hypothetical protein